MMMMMMIVLTMTLLMTTRTILFSTRGHSACSVGRRPALPRGRVRAALSSTHVREKARALPRRATIVSVLDHVARQLLQVSSAPVTPPSRAFSLRVLLAVY